MKTNFRANLYAINDLRYENAPIPSCAEDEVLIEIKCCGICGSSASCFIYSNDNGNRRKLWFTKFYINNSWYGNG